jgi:hypothetical protein
MGDWRQRPVFFGVRNGRQCFALSLAAGLMGWCMDFVDFSVLREEEEGYVCM